MTASAEPTRNARVLAPAGSARLHTLAALVLSAGLAVSLCLSAGLSPESRRVVAAAGALAGTMAFWADRHNGTLRSPRFCLIASLCLLPVALAVAGALNPHGHYDAATRTWAVSNPPVDFFPTAADPTLALEQALHLAGAALALFAAYLLAPSAIARRVLYAAVVALALVGGVSMVLSGGAWAQHRSADWTAPLPDGPYRYHAHATALLCITLPLAFLGLPRGIGRTIAGTLVALLALCSGSRIGTAVVLTLIPAMFLWSPVLWRRLTAFCLLAVIPLVALTAMTWSRAAPFSLLGRGLGSARLIIWNLTADAISRRPLTGHGAGSFPILLPQLAPEHSSLYANWIVNYPADTGTLSAWSVACNDILQFTSELGLAGITPALVLFCWAAIAAWEKASGALVLALMAFLAHAMVDWPAYNSTILAVSAILAGISLRPVPDTSSRPSLHPA